MKTSVYRNAAVLACSLGLLGLLVGCFGMSVSFETTDPDSATSPPNETSQVASNVSSSVAHETLTPTNVSDSVTTTSSQVEDSTSQSTTRLAYRQESIGTAKDRGTLRMSNQTNQPVRLALLARQSKGNSALKNQQDIPAHWDFAPQEGSEKGLLLSLPNGNLKLEKGDVVVAFAQDGSRRYWGPYVVGETSLPKWDAQKQEWLLILTQ
ncbi:hypothetical protein H6G41_11715 [Tolypothrix sp. FACHB-123]|uniref:hypothetical protein n=1 Tax=Tolypothrix sp. FACHB-123 TaxID=2692868 RepID=UPI001682BD5E|nr:hypothetical protein [Tolypothrix sp. FACHB-123]MBD2355277.1 hypothetical protein [Tolypothrix sp. FACHB-123]